VAEFLDQQLGGVLIDGVVQRDHHAHLEQRLDQIGGLFGHTVGQFLHGDRLGHHHVADLLLARLALAREVSATLLLTRTLERGEAAGAGALILVQSTGHGQLAAATLVGTLAITRGGGGLLGGRGLGATHRSRNHRREATRRGRGGRSLRTGGLSGGRRGSSRRFLRRSRLDLDRSGGGSDGLGGLHRLGSGNGLGLGGLGGAGRFGSGPARCSSSMARWRSSCSRRLWASIICMRASSASRRRRACISWRVSLLGMGRGAGRAGAGAGRWA
jgi:hypothetical protein